MEPPLGFSNSIVFGTLSLLAGLPIHARTIHVSPNGDDLASGSLAAPLATIGKAATSSVPGDTILIRAGTYKLKSQIDPQSGSSPAQRITYRAYPGESVTIDGQSGYCIGLTGRSYLTFQGLKFTTQDTAVGAGMIYLEGTRHAVFQDCEFHGMPAPRGGENSAVIRCMSTGWPDSANTQNSDSCVFRNNHFHDNASPALRLYDTKGWVIENNLFENCVQAIGAKDEPYDMIVQRNLIVGGDLAFYFPLQGGGRNVTITENIVSGTGGGLMIGGLGTYETQRRNLQVYNNSFHDVGTLLMGWSESKYDTMIGFWNNIFHSDTAMNIPAGADVGARFVSVNKYQTERMEPTDYSFDHNDYSMPANDRSTAFIDARVSYADLAAWQKARAPFDAHSMSKDPKFLHPKSRDFHLGADSPCKGAGKNGEDLGAYPRGDDGTVIGIMPSSPTSLRSRPGGKFGSTIGQTATDRLVNGRLVPSRTRSLTKGEVTAPF